MSLRTDSPAVRIVTSQDIHLILIYKYLMHFMIHIFFQNHKDFLQLMINASKGQGNNKEGETKGELTYDDYKARGFAL